ncbi:hypothetical protein H8I69_20970 [Serratia fonticola]|jgi:hypothetical protein|uniref:hypothetical protein n=1 Tax=Serratia fonticola TaxID=47917 RepID=UPI0015C5A9FB|nr:hypothetical protein [Serratia fonticola]MBC3381593.1 hypothetical protein [Serratia fonticola]NYA40792.1 hypothetical protein [Serratia fonticola]
MTEKSEFFSSFTEIERRASFSAKQEISPDNFQELVGMYRFEEDVICQVRVKKGICHQKHKSGWLGVTKEGTEALIGGHCAREYFKADRNFSFERKRVKKEIERKKALSKLDEYRSQVLVFSMELSSLRSKFIEVRKKLDSIYKSFPDVILRFIYESQKTKNWQINVDVTYPGRYQWVIEPLCNLRSISPMQEVISSISKVKYLIEIYDEICKLDPTTVATPKLKKLLDVISDKERLEKEGEYYLQETDKFIEPKNLDSLLYVCNDYEDEFLTVRAILSITGAKVSSDAHIKLRIRRIIERVEKQFAGCEVRKNQLITRYKKSSFSKS